MIGQGKTSAMLEHLNQVPLSSTLGSFSQMASTVLQGERSSSSGVPQGHIVDRSYATLALAISSKGNGDLQHLHANGMQAKLDPTPNAQSFPCVRVPGLEVSASARMTQPTLPKNGIEAEHKSASGPRGYDDRETPLEFSYKAAPRRDSGSKSHESMLFEPAGKLTKA